MQAAHHLKSLHSYSIPRACNGLNIPIALQSACQRDYANKNGFTFILPKVEWCITNIYKVLYEMVTDSTISHISMCSFLMLPDLKRRHLYTRLERKGLTYHFVLENATVEATGLLDYNKKMFELSKYETTLLAMRSE